MGQEKGTLEVCGDRGRQEKILALLMQVITWRYLIPSSLPCPSPNVHQLIAESTALGGRPVCLMTELGLKDLNRLILWTQYSRRKSTGISLKT